MRKNISDTNTNSIQIDIIQFVYEICEKHIPRTTVLFGKLEPYELLWVLIKICEKYKLNKEFLASLDTKDMTIMSIAEQVAQKIHS